MPQGLFIVGALGEVASTLLFGLEAFKSGEAPPTGLMSEMPLLNQLDLVKLEDLVVSGVDIKDGASINAMEKIVRQGGAIPWPLWDTLQKKGALDSLPTIQVIEKSLKGASRFEHIKKLLNDFKKLVSSSCTVLYLASAEESYKNNPIETVEDFERLLADDGLPDSVLWAKASIDEQMGFVNFTPSIGIDLPYLKSCAQSQIAYAGNDGKTGETLLKTVLAPMFFARNFDVLSWESLNLLGNRDGENLQNPKNAETKLSNKDQVIHSLLGQDVHTKTRIDYTASLGDWKTAWNLIHFKGFLDIPMSMQFTWQGCDSSLAAPLCLDLVRLNLHSLKREEYGLMRYAACFFKHPLEENEHDFFKQLHALEVWAKNQ